VDKATYEELPYGQGREPRSLLDPVVAVRLDNPVSILLLHAFPVWWMSHAAGSNELHVVDSDEACR
jgi:hypothetical protein